MQQTQHYAKKISSNKRAYAICLLGIVVLFLPSYFMLATNTWRGEDESHGPIVLVVAGWVFWKVRHGLFTLPTTPSSNQRIFGWLTLFVGLGLMAVGRIGQVPSVEVGSHLVILFALLLVMGGFSAVRICLFALLFLAFMVPLPNNLIDSLTGSLKQYVSVIAESILYAAGYPVARSGVSINIGQYQLLVADACSGLKSIFSLSAVGLIYIYVSQHQSKARNWLLALALVPIAFFANIIRVMILILVTYHFGDAAAQGFLHEFAGMILFVLALGMLFIWDGFLGLFRRFTRPRRQL